MGYPLGKPVQVNAYYTDGGLEKNGLTVTCELFDPSETLTTPAVTARGEGLYEVVVTPSVAGFWFARFTTTSEEVDNQIIEVGFDVDQAIPTSETPSSPIATPTVYNSLRQRLGVPTKTIRGTAGENLASGDTVYLYEGKWYVIAAADAEGIVTSSTIAADAAGNIKTYGGFTDSELDEIWVKVEGASSDINREYAALAEMAFRLRNNAAKLHNYSVGSNSESLAQVFQHLDKIYAEMKPYLDEALGVTRRQVAKVGVGAPKRYRERPY